MIALAVISCGDSGGGGSGNSDRDGGSEPDEPTGKGECSKGAYPGDHNALNLCGAGRDCSSNEIPLSKFVGYTSYEWDINLTAGTEKDLSALSCLESLGGGFTVGRGSEMKDLTGLAKLKKASSINVVRMDKLTSLAGLESLTETNELVANFNPGLTELSGLPSGFKTKTLRVLQNENLTSIAGLADIVVTETVAIENNPKLSQCEAEAFAATQSGAEAIVDSNLDEATCP